MIAIIVAMTKDRIIGVDNKLPWDIPEDLKNFKKLTSGNTVIMGRKTFDSIGRPLPNRNNIVVTKSKDDIYGVDIAHDIQEALEKAQSYEKDVFIIGGSSIYRQMLRFADKMFISFIKKKVEGDAYFPEINKDDWQQEERKQFPEFDFVVYRRKN